VSEFCSLKSDRMYAATSIRLDKRYPQLTWKKRRGLRIFLVITRVISLTELIPRRFKIRFYMVEIIPEFRPVFQVLSI
jgi:hypothetical protein